MTKLANIILTLIIGSVKVVVISNGKVTVGSLIYPLTAGPISSNHEIKGVATRPEVPDVKIVSCEMSNCFKSYLGKLMLLSRVVPGEISDFFIKNY